MPPVPSHFLGLAPFLRQTLAGENLQTIAQPLLSQVEQNPSQAASWLNLSTIFLCLGQRDLGLQFQQYALALQGVYVVPAQHKPPRLRLLLLTAAGELSANTPIDCLLEDSDIELIFYYVRDDQPLAYPIPEHDVLMLAMGEAPSHQSILRALAPLLVDWPVPVINPPLNILSTERRTASQLLQGVKGLTMPQTYTLTREKLEAVAHDALSFAAIGVDCDFPLIVRPLGSHAGIGLSRLQDRQALALYLQEHTEETFYISQFIDYSDQDGLFRKYRIALIAGEAFACHMAISSHWMVHYVNAGMYEDADKRAEEAQFFDHFSAFAKRHGEALSAIQQRSGLDYVCVDCAETPNGDLLAFEIDPAMVVHAMDPLPMFAYKQAPIEKARAAFRDFLIRLINPA